MRNRLRMATTVIICAMGSTFANVALGVPVTNILATTTVPTNVQSVHWYGRGGWGWHGHGGWGWGWGAGLAAGAIVGSALAAPYYYYPGPYYPAYYDNPYYGPAPYYAVPAGNAVAYCMQRFRSYDPRSGTYMGYDGFRHPCP